MVTTIPNNQDMCGLSTDTKPTTGVPNGAVFIEMDTKKMYAYDEASGQWIEQ